MDPNACFRQFLQALDDNDLDLAIEYRVSLREWLDKGGFAPDWTKEEKDRFYGPTLNPEYNKLLIRLHEHGCIGGPGCEECGCDLTGQNVVDTNPNNKDGMWVCEVCAKDELTYIAMGGDSAIDN